VHCGYGIRPGSSTLVTGFQDEDDAMKCSICKQGETSSGLATVTLDRAGTVAVIRAVPAEICGDCGEYYLDGDTTRRVLEQAEAAAQRHVEVEIVRFAA
jgi:YgiT-type zinc finger domain-containing protein